MKDYCGRAFSWEFYMKSFCEFSMCDLETLKHSLVCDADLQPQHSLVCDADPQSQHSLVCDAELQLVSSSREPGQKGQKRVKGQPGLQRELGGGGILNLKMERKV